MNKQEIIDELLIKHSVWEAGYTRADLEVLTHKYLKNWLENLEDM